MSLIISVGGHQLVAQLVLVCSIAMALLTRIELARAFLMRVWWHLVSETIGSFYNKINIRIANATTGYILVRLR